MGFDGVRGVLGALSGSLAGAGEEGLTLRDTARVRGHASDVTWTKAI